MPEARIGRARAIHSDDVGKFVYAHGGESVAGIDRLIRVTRCGDAEKDPVAGRCTRVCIAAVAEIPQRQVDATIRNVVEESLMGRERAEESLRDVRHEVVFVRIVINDP